MAVTIEKRPIGVILGTCVSATINQDYSSVFATVNKTSHGLSDGDYVYIRSNVQNYNGFWKIEVTNANEFLLIDNPYVAWVVDADITYCPQDSTHGWSAVELPIVYELSNTKFPTNSVDTVRTISSISNDNNLVNLNLSGSLGTFEDLSFVKISNAPNSDYNGVYQILDKLATNDVTLSTAYDSVTASGLVGASIQLYYGNYNFVVRVYAGINSGHTWADQKPYELAATLEIIPDENNRAKFSINEILKAYVETKNNLLLPALPNNTDAWTNFYIEVGEQYDTSNGYTISTFEGAFASDQSTFEGTAVNAKLVFKNIHSGSMSEYLMTNSSGLFLTLFLTPVLFSCGEDTPDCYQDISFINSDNSGVSIKKEYYSNDVLVITEIDTITSSGVIRTELNADCSYDRLDVTVTDLLEWEAQTAAAAIQWESVTFGNGLFVAVASNGVNQVMTSPDGETWTIQTAPSAAWSGVTFGNNLFVAVGTGVANDGIMTSPDGITWNTEVSPTNDEWRAVTYGNGLFVAVGNIVDSADVAYSSDGVNWTAVTAFAGGWQGVTYGNGLFVAVGVDNAVMTSPDGQNWTLRTGTTTTLLDVAFNGSYFVAVGLNGVMRSADGITWQAVTEATNSDWSGVWFDGTIFVAVATTTGVSMISFDNGLTWESIPTPNNSLWSSVVFGADKFVAVASSGAGDRVMTLSTEARSETKTFDIECGCSNQDIRLTWLNNLGGFDYWKFTGETDHVIDITAAGETKQNIFPEWPKSYGETADTIRKQTFRESAKREFIFSQFLTQDQADAISYIKSSSLVQIINSRQDRRTVIVDTDSFSKYKDGDKTFTISFNILYTDDIPSQTV